VWARKGVAVECCPKSWITAESQALVEEFFIRRRLGSWDFGELSARQVEAFAWLETALAGERKDGQHNTRRSSR
jgi:hypothetical protein